MKSKPHEELFDRADWAVQQDKRHTSEEFSVSETTFYADGQEGKGDRKLGAIAAVCPRHDRSDNHCGSRDCKQDGKESHCGSDECWPYAPCYCQSGQAGKFNRLQRYQAGTDGQTHAGESDNGPFRQKRSEKENVRITQAICQGTGMPIALQKRVEAFVRREETRRFSKHYAGIYGKVLAGIALTVADTEAEARRSEWVQSAHYQRVAEAHDINVDALLSYAFEQWPQQEATARNIHEFETDDRPNVKRSNNRALVSQPA